MRGLFGGRGGRNCDVRLGLGALGRRRRAAAVVKLYFSTSIIQVIADSLLFGLLVLGLSL